MPQAVLGRRRAVKARSALRLHVKGVTPEIQLRQDVALRVRRCGADEGLAASQAVAVVLLGTSHDAGRAVIAILCTAADRHLEIIRLQTGLSDEIPGGVVRRHAEIAPFAANELVGKSWVFATRGPGFSNVSTRTLHSHLESINVQIGFGHQSALGHFRHKAICQGDSCS